MFIENIRFIFAHVVGNPPSRLRMEFQFFYCYNTNQIKKQTYLSCLRRVLRILRYIVIIWNNLAFNNALKTQVFRASSSYENPRTKVCAYVNLNVIFK